LFVGMVVSGILHNILGSLIPFDYPS